MHKSNSKILQIGHVLIRNVVIQSKLICRFFFDFAAIYVGVGMICPYIINISVLLGGIISWGIMWPLIKTKEGDWYDKGLGEGNLHGIQGYRVSSLI